MRLHCLTFSAALLAAGCGDSLSISPLGEAGARDGTGSEGRDAAVATLEVAQGPRASEDLGAGDRLSAAACGFGEALPELQLPSSEVKGVLRGASRNPSTTCTRQKSAGGPEAVFRLRLAERAVVELEAVSNLDTVLAIRTTCDDPLSEVACNDGPMSASPMVPGPPTPPIRDASVTPGGMPIVAPSGSRDGRLRVALEPGLYYVLLDEAEPYGVGGDYLLKVRATPPLAAAACQGAMPIVDGASFAAEQLDLAGERPLACAAEARPALHYAVRIPSGQRLTARVAATGGDRAWTPVAHLLGDCSQKQCLGSSRASPQGDQLLRYVNNGPTPLEVILAVTSTTPVGGATFRLDVAVGDPVLNQSCQTALPLADGLVLRNQDLSEGGQVPPGPGGRCAPVGGPTLYYKATVLDQQRLRVTITTRATGPFAGRTGTFVTIRDGCNGSCIAPPGPNTTEYTNTTGAPKTVIVAVTSFMGGAALVFDLMASLPLPPGGVQVNAGASLRTSEGGGQATFTVALKSPPTAAVTIPIESDAPTEGRPSPASLVFTADNWDKPQTVTVTGVDDDTRDGHRPYKVLVKAAMSADSRYMGLAGGEVTLVNRDDEPGFTFDAPAILSTSESGTTATFTVVLDGKPSAAVRLGLRSGDATEGKVSPADLVFTPEDWDKPKVVSVTGVDDSEKDGPQTYKVFIDAAMSSDPRYAGQDPVDLDARNSDNDLDRLAAYSIGPPGILCGTGGSGQRVAVDPAGNIFVIMVCERGGGQPDGGVMKASVDGGLPLGDAGPPAPQDPPPDEPDQQVVLVGVSSDNLQTSPTPSATGMTAPSEVHVATAGPGVAHVVATAYQGLLYTRTEDAGKTWARVHKLNPTGGEGRIASQGQTVVVTSNTYDGPKTWISRDGGRDWKRVEALDGRPLAVLRVGADGTVFVITAEVPFLLRKSTDGVTFDAGQRLMPGGTEDAFPGVARAFGPTTLFHAGNDSRLWLLTLAGGKASSVDGLSGQIAGPRALVLDAFENVTVLDNTPFGVDLRRLAAGTTTLTARRLVGRSESGATGAALSDAAIVYVYERNGQVMGGVELWP